MNPTHVDPKFVHIATVIGEGVLAVVTQSINGYPVSKDSSSVVKIIGGNIHLVNNFFRCGFPAVSYGPVDVHTGDEIALERFVGPAARGRFSNTVFRSTFSDPFDIPINVAVRDSFAWAGRHGDWGLCVRWKGRGGPGCKVGIRFG